MRRTLHFILAVVFLTLPTACAFALNVYSPALKVRLQKEIAKNLSRNDEMETSPYIPMLLKVEDYQIEDTLATMGVITYGKREHILLTSIPRDSVESVLALPQIIDAEMSGDPCVLLDVARPMCHVNNLQSALPPLSEIYDGTGVVVGFSDIGFDARHIAFKNKISAIYTYNARQGIKQIAETSTAIAEWTTDNPNEYHATHVGNILGGNYKGAPYWGVATGAEMVVTTSTLTDVGILAGVDDIISYAKTHDKRAVVNLSLGSFVGPHDGTSLFCRYLSSCADEAVICLAAGNKGNTQCYATTDLNGSNTIKRVVTNDLATWTGKKVDGMTDIWSVNGNPFNLRVEVYDKETKSIAYASDWTDHNLDSDEIYISSQDNEEFARYLEGEVYAAAGISKLNGRFYAEIAYSVVCQETQSSSDGKWARYAIAIAVKGVGENQGVTSHIEFFADANTSFIGSASSEDAPRFSHDGTISDMCTASGVISVGNCSSRNTAPSLFGKNGTVSWNFQVGEPEINSSYSTSPYIGRYPHLSAPGNMVVSALSGEYYAAHPSESPDITAVTTVDDTNYYWIALSGTSMASPMAAGIIAQWIQADPNISTSEIIEIAQSTCTSFSDMANPRWGAGCIDALAGLRKVKEMNGICDITVDDLFGLSNQQNNHFLLPSGVEAYTIDGKKITTNQSLKKGIYIIVDSYGIVRKICIK